MVAPVGAVSLFQLSTLAGEFQAGIEAEVIFKEISLLDKDYFQLVRGKRITRSTINSNQGKIPVYSSSKDEYGVLGHISEKFLKAENLVLFDQPSILMNLDGSVGHCFIRRDEKYSFIDVVAALMPTVEGIDLEYLRFELETRIKESGANYQTKLYFGKIKSRDIKVKIPVREDGTFDLEIQQELAKKYQAVAQMKAELNSKLEAMARIEVGLS